MALTPGTRIGSYEITAQIGVGGMGEVYRATDTNLGRAVAIKVLPDAVAGDAERLARFDREARTLAALNHPNIAQIHGLERSGGQTALVMELVEGPTLADRIAEGPIPVDEALSIAKQIAEALEAAHEQGIIHRDLKPANIKLRLDGTVKVLDFGLAKAMEPGAGTSSSLSMSPTITTPAMTQAGLILGTAAYMSPEQARGKPVDRRADIWAFGCVLFEMLTGSRAFEGEDIADTLGNVMKVEPSWERVPSSVPARVERVLRACLQKKATQRLDSAQAVRLALDGAFETAAAPVVAAPAPVVLAPLWRRAVPVAAAALVAGVVVGFAVRALTPSDPRPIVRSVHALPEDRGFRNTGRTAVAVAPDGRHFAYNAAGGLYLRRLDAVDDQPILGTENPLMDPTFSPDGDSVAFFSAGGAGVSAAAGGLSLMRLAVTGGATVTLTTIRSISFGLRWESDGTLLYGASDGIWSVSENGGEPTQLVATEAGEQASSPQRLPGGWVLFTLRGAGEADWDEAAIVAQAPASGERRMLLRGAGARYLPTGHLVYALQNVLYAVPFDVDRLEVTGGPTPVVQGVRRANATGAAQVAVTADGMLVYLPGTAANLEDVSLAIADPSGQFALLPATSGAYDHPRISPDGRWVAYTETFSDGEDVSVYEIGSGASPRRLTFGGMSRMPVWSADSTRVVFQSEREGDRGLFWQLADGTGAVERLTTPAEGEAHQPDSVSPDGASLLFTVASRGGQNPNPGSVNGEAAVWVLALPGGDAEPLVAVPSARVQQAAFSPDGRWIAYQSNETGEDEVFVQPFPPTGAKYLLPNTLDNHHPLWSPDGRELFYIPGQGQFAVVGITTAPRFGFGNPTPLPVGTALRIGSPAQRRRHDIMPDGSGFIGIVSSGGDLNQDDRRVHIVQHWFEELRRLVPAD